MSGAAGAGRLAPCSSSNGSQRMNSAPWPGPSLKASTSPPCRAAARERRDAASQRQADAEAAERARQGLVLLREQLEGVWQEVRVDALALVLDGDLHRLRGAPHG